MNKVKFSLRERLIPFSKRPALVWILVLVTVYMDEFTSWKILITFKYSLSVVGDYGC